MMMIVNLLNTLRCMGCTYLCCQINKNVINEFFTKNWLQKYDNDDDAINYFTLYE